MRRAGFTLIELLVVITIIAVLAAILFPALAAARSKSQQSKCLSNLRQLCTAMLLYLDDSEETYPYDMKPRAPARDGAVPAYDGTNKWDGSPVVARLYPYLRSTEVAYCPDRSRDLPDIGPSTNYEFNGFIALNDSAQTPHPGPVKTQDIPNPASVLLFEDYSEDPDYHAGYRNFALCDGSARAYPSNMQGALPCHGKWWY